MVIGVTSLAGPNVGVVTTATERFREMVERDESDIALDEAALLIAAHAHPDLDVDAHLTELDVLAAGCSEPGMEPWRRHLFVDVGFAGDLSRYGDPESSLLDDAIRSHSGLPITLSVLAMEVARRLDLDTFGVGMPSHFLVGVRDGGEVLYVDAFNGGQVLDRQGCARLFAGMNIGAAFEDSFLDPVGPRLILGRMLANLKAAYARRNNLAALRWVTDLRLAIPGAPPIERRYRARLLAASGRFDEAANELEDLADVLPDDVDTLTAEAFTYWSRLN